MKVFLIKKLILFALPTAVFLTLNSMCLAELMKPSLQSREDYDDKYYERASVGNNGKCGPGNDSYPHLAHGPVTDTYGQKYFPLTSFEQLQKLLQRRALEIKDNILEEKQRSLNFDEMKDWASKNIIKMNIPAVNRVPNSVANLPLRFGRNDPEERSIKPIANLPLRFGRAFGESLPRPASNLSHRLGRSPFVKSVIQSLLNLPQRFGKSLSVNLSQDVQESEPGI